MKRLNYYQVHKNKKPKVKRKLYINLAVIKSSMLTAISALQTRLIMSQPISIELKALKVGQNTLETANSILQIFKEEKKRKYLERIKKYKK